MKHSIDDLMTADAVRIDDAPHWWRVRGWSREKGLSIHRINNEKITLENVPASRVTEIYETEFYDAIVAQPTDRGNMKAGGKAEEAIGVEICKWFGKNPHASVSAPGYDPRWSYVAGSFGVAIERALEKAGYEIRLKSPTTSPTS